LRFFATATNKILSNGNKKEDMVYDLSAVLEKQTQLIYTIDEIVDWMRKVAGQTGYAQLQYYDKNGNLVTKNIPTIPQLIEQFRQGVNAQMSKIVYVNQQEGSDTTGDGSQNAPFKTIQKAISSVPVGGLVGIHVLGDYECELNIEIHGKHVVLVLHGTLIHRWKKWTNAQGKTYDALAGFSIYRYGSLEVVAMSDKGGKIVVDSGSPTNVTPLFDGAYRVRADASYGVFYFSIWARQDNYNPIVVKSGQLVSISQWSFLKPPLIAVSIAGHYNGTNRSIRVYSGAHLINLRNTNGHIYLHYAGGWQDENGNTIDPKTKIAGIIRDANGTPRNVTSNLVL